MKVHARVQSRLSSSAALVAVTGRAADQRAPDEERVAAIRAGDEAVFEEIFREHYQGLCAFAVRRVRSDQVAEELVQTVLLRLWQQRSEIRVSGSLAGYLYGAVRNAALMHLRRRQLEQRWQDSATAETAALLMGEPPPPPDAMIRSAEMAAAIERVVEQLPPRCREAYRLRREDHLSYAEIAEIMGISPKTVEVQIGAALKALRAALAGW